MSRPASLSVALLGIMAATVSVAWHSHIHMAMVFIPSLLYLAGADRLPRRLLNAWVFVPSGLFLVAVFLPPALARAGVIANPGATYVYFLFAAAQLAVNLLLFDWALRRSPQKA